MKTFKFLLPVIAFLFCFNFVSAQEMKAEKYENIEWYNILYVINGRMEKPMMPRG